MTLRLLVAEDSKTMQRVLEIALSQQDVALTMAAGRAEALEAARRAPFDLLLVDGDLPDTDGYTLCRELRDACVRDVPVVLMTSAQHPFDPARAAHVGAKAHIDKPFATQALVGVVMTAIGASQPSPAEGASPPDTPAGPLEPNHMAAIDAALAALCAEPDVGAGAPKADEGGAHGARPPAFIRLENDESPATAAARTRPKPFFEEETTSSRAFGGPKSPVTVVRRPSDALREQSRMGAPLPSVDALPAMPDFQAPSPPQQPAATVAASAKIRLAPQQSVAASPPPPPQAIARSMTQELIALLQQGPHNASTPAINAAMTAALEQQLAQILWQIVPGIVTEEVRRLLAHAPPKSQPGPQPPTGSL